MSREIHSEGRGPQSEVRRYRTRWTAWTEVAGCTLGLVIFVTDSTVPVVLPPWEPRLF